MGRNSLWWFPFARGVLSVLLGLLLLAWPKESAEAFVMLIGAFALLVGLVRTLNATAWRGPIRGFALTSGIVTLLLGLAAFLWPGLTATVFVLLVAAWALLFGLFEIAVGLAMPPGIPAKALTMGMGLISVTLAILLAVAPEVGIVAASWLIGFYFLATGALTIYYAIELRRHTPPWVIIVR